MNQQRNAERKAWAQVYTAALEYVNDNTTGTGHKGDFPPINPGTPLHAAVVELEKHLPGGKLPMPEPWQSWCDAVALSREPGQRMRDIPGLVLRLVGEAMKVAEPAAKAPESKGARVEVEVYMATIGRLIEADDKLDLKGACEKLEELGFHAPYDQVVSKTRGHKARQAWDRVQMALQNAYRQSERNGWRKDE